MHAVREKWLLLRCLILWRIRLALRSTRAGSRDCHRNLNGSELKEPLIIVNGENVFPLAWLLALLRASGPLYYCNVRYIHVCTYKHLPGIF